MQDTQEISNKNPDQQTEQQSTRDEKHTERTRKEQFVRETQENFFGRRYVGNTLSKILAPSFVSEKILKFLERPINFLVYLGNPGCGKTYMCSAMTEWALDSFRWFRYYNERELLSKIRKSMDGKGDYLEELNYLMDSHLVMLDDLGSSGVNDWRQEIWMEAIDVRYSSGKPTIITSNFTRNEIKEKFHERIYSRLFAKGNIIIELPNGEDHRKPE